MNSSDEDRIGSCVVDEPMQPFSRNLSVYIPMPDGVKIAVDIWLSDTENTEDKFPVAVEFTVIGELPRVKPQKTACSI